MKAILALSGPQAMVLYDCAERYFIKLETIGHRLRGKLGRNLGPGISVHLACWRRK